MYNKHRVSTPPVPKPTQPPSKSKILPIPHPFSIYQSHPTLRTQQSSPASASARRMDPEKEGRWGVSRARTKQYRLRPIRNACSKDWLAAGDKEVRLFASKMWFGQLAGQIWRACPFLPPKSSWCLLVAACGLSWFEKGFL